MKIEEIGGVDDYMEFNVSTHEAEAWIEIHNPWVGDTDSGFGASAQMHLTKDQARDLAVALLAWCAA